MLGWHISVYRQNDGGRAPAPKDSPHTTPLAVWQAGLFGLKWLNKLVEGGYAINLGGDGYPFRFTAQAKYVIPYVRNPPDINETWALGDNDVVTAQWIGKTFRDVLAVNQCREDEWLLIEAWDES